MRGPAARISAYTGSWSASFSHSSRHSSGTGSWSPYSVSPSGTSPSCAASMRVAVICPSAYRVCPKTHPRSTSRTKISAGTGRMSDNPMRTMTGSPPGRIRA